MTYTVLTPESLRASYANITDRLIYTMEGHDGWKPDEVLYLDKSGRPVAWLVKALWPVLAREPGTAYAEGRVPTMPGIRIANIDREQWWSMTGGSETGVIDVGLVPANLIEELRGVFIVRRPRPGEPVREVPAWLDGRNVLVVDEVRSSGDTLRIASGLVERAFPTASVRGAYWMTPTKVTDRHGLTRVKDMPVWYRSDTWKGRLVGNRLDGDNPSSTWRQRNGARFLSTRAVDHDDKGHSLRAEAFTLAADVAAGRLLAAPYAQRDPDDWEERVKALYGYATGREFTAARIAAGLA